MAGKGPRYWKNKGTMDLWRLFQKNYGSAKNLEELVKLSRAHSPVPGESHYSRKVKASKAAA